MQRVKTGNTLSRWTAWLLTAAMLLALLPTAAFAADDSADFIDKLTLDTENGTTYQALFPVINAYDAAYWNDVALQYNNTMDMEQDGDFDADDAAGIVSMLQNYFVGEKYGQDAMDAYGDGSNGMVFNCGFIGGVDEITFNGHTISGTLAGAPVFSHEYTYEGVLGVGAQGTGMYFEGALYKTVDENADAFTYFLLRDDNPTDTYHIEFRYGSSKEGLAGYLTGEYAYWLAAGIPVDADDALKEDCIELLVRENVHAESDYVLMNIPYDDFYRADLDGKNSTAVDAVTSATMTKPRTGTLVGGSYHTDESGADISGITYAVQVDESAKAWLAEQKQVWGNDAVSITVTNRGQTTTTVYRGKDALFENENYAYYMLSTAPSSYKVLTLVDGKPVFSGTNEEAQPLPTATAVLSTDSSYGDYQIAVTGLPDAVRTVYGVVLHTDDGSAYALRHLENIWQKTNLAFSTGHTTQVHGSPTAAAHYTSMEGKTIEQMTYYTDSGVYTIATALAVPAYPTGTFAARFADAQTVRVDVPEAYAAEEIKVSVYVEGRTETTYLAQDVIPQNGAVALTAAPVGGTEYTVSFALTGYPVLKTTAVYQTYAVSVRNDMVGGTVAVKDGVSEAMAGETVSFAVTPESDAYTLASVGYWKIADDGTAGSLTTLKVGEDGYYTFTMPESNVGVGASFENAGDMPTKSETEKKEDLWTVYTALQVAFLHPSDRSAQARIVLDKRFAALGDSEMIAELRQYDASGYRVVGSTTYAHDAFVALCDAGTETDGKITIDSLDFNLSTEESFEPDKTVYCFIKVGRIGWVDARGEPLYRTAYTDDAKVLAEETAAPAPIVWLYNLDANAHRGALVRSILDDLDIPYDTVDSSNLGQNIGYLVGWDGYAPVDDPYCADSFDVEYMLMGNLVETKLDDLLDSMQEHNIRVNLKSVPTTWTAGKTFVELFSIMAGEDAAFKALLELDGLIYDADQVLADTTIEKQGEAWEQFQAAYDAAVAALTGEEELEAEDYQALIDALRSAYLAVTQKTMLTGEAELLLEQDAAGNYRVSVQLNHAPAGATYACQWQDQSTGQSVTVAADQLYKVKLTLSGTGSFYGTMTAKLSVPAHPSTAVSTGTDRVFVRFAAPQSVLNTPAVTAFVAELYQNGTLLETKTSNQAQTLTFTGLTRETDYTVKTYVTNAVGRSDMLEQTARTTASGGGSSGGSSSSAATTTPETPDVPAETPTEQPTEQPVDAFGDMENHWSRDAVNWALGEKLFNGTAETTFSPDLSITRAMMVTLLYRLEGEPAVTAANPFADVQAGQWYTDAVIWANENGIASGVGGGNFAPAANITREQLAVMLYNYAQYNGLDVSVGADTNILSYDDAAHVSEYAMPAMQWACGAGLLSGRTASTLAPQGTATRAEAATILMRFVQSLTSGVSR